ncbi:MAG: hypothetical protein H0T76_20535 [Nannocystis sp.]|nr:hypothetical protein [Nannocystis sp.]MBA3548878.1 hypothetical protein [Nannocystis sp.]
MRLLGALASLVLQVACVERTLNDDPAPYDPEADERTNDEVLRDFCELWVECELDLPVLDEPTCLWYFELIIDGDGVSPEKPPECAIARWDQLACVSEADSCEGFKASWFYRQPDTDRCDEPAERFNAADCGV